ncbi:hypothetical protein D9757_002760 [Collybiopsis confluens]|uniref:Bromo domain-containing protein n=1 Tax=Collybiopsis confluens TaxID=2823264 RepID=A0A8H5HW13_9AGAR|nr:hypothetical protein D9757_002760 [Collybiopsis confluens]
MGGRSTRRTPQELDFSLLSKLDRLILAQSVYELGAAAWPAVAKVLSKHPLLSHPKSFFTAQTCQAIYKHLRNEASLEITDADSDRHSPLNLKLAQIHYQARILELQSLIGEEEERFKQLASEIEELKQKPSASMTKTEGELEASTSDLFASPEKIDTEMTMNPDSTSVEAGSNTTAEPESDRIDAAEISANADVLSPQVVEEVLLKAEPEDEEAPATVKEIPHEHKEDYNETESLPTPPQPTGITESRANSSAPPAVDAEDEASRAVTPHESIADTETDRVEVVDEEGVTSNDEYTGLQKARLAKAAKRQRKAGTPIQTQTRKTRRLRRTSGFVENTPERGESITEDDKAQTPVTMDEDASPAPEPALLKRQGKRRASPTDDNPRETRRLRADSEPVDDEDGTGPSTSRRRRQENQATKRFQNVIGMLHSQISAHRNGTIFHNPIKNSEAPDYHDIVKRPMDLKTIKSKIKDGFISNSLEFQRDIYLMFANAMMYNRPGSDVYIMAEDMMLECEGYIQTFRQSEGFVRGSR